MSTMQAAQTTLPRNAVVLPKAGRIDVFSTTPPQLPPLHVLKRDHAERIRAEAREWQRKAVEAAARARERSDVASKARLHEASRLQNERAVEEREWFALLARAKVALRAEEAEWTALRERALARSEAGLAAKPRPASR